MGWGAEEGEGEGELRGAVLCCVLLTSEQPGDIVLRGAVSQHGERVHALRLSLLLRRGALRALEHQLQHLLLLHLLLLLLLRVCSAHRWKGVM